MTVDRLYRSEIQIPAAGVGSGGVSAHVAQITHDSLITNCSTIMDANGAGRAQLDGGDLIATTDLAGNNRVALHVVRWVLDNNPALSDVLVHVGPLSLSSASLNTIYLWWGHASSQSQPAAGAPFGQYAVYESAATGFWGMDEGSGTAAADYTSNANNGTLTNGPTWSTGKVGKATVFDGVNDHVAIPSTATLNTTMKSVAFWISIDNPSSGATNCIFANVPASEASGWAVQTVINTGRTGFTIRKWTPEQNSTFDSGFLFGAGQWTHGIITCDATNGRLYINGVLRDTTAHGTPTAGAAIARIGTDSRGAFAFLGGKLDDVRIYNRVLNSAEAATLYNNGNAPGTFAVAQAPESVSTWSAALFRTVRARRVHNWRPRRRHAATAATWLFSARNGPYTVAARGTYLPGSAHSETFVAGCQQSAVHLAGAVAAQAGGS